MFEINGITPKNRSNTIISKLLVCEGLPIPTPLLPFDTDDRPLLIVIQDKYVGMILCLIGTPVSVFDVGVLFFVLFCKIIAQNLESYWNWR